MLCLVEDYGCDLCGGGGCLVAKWMVEVVFAVTEVREHWLWISEKLCWPWEGGGISFMRNFQVTMSVCVCHLQKRFLREKLRKDIVFLFFLILQVWLKNCRADFFFVIATHYWWIYVTISNSILLCIVGELAVPPGSHLPLPCRSPSSPLLLTFRSTSAFCGYYIWTLFVKKLCRHFLWTLFVHTFCGHFLEHFMWTLFLDTFCGHFFGHFLWTLLLNILVSFFLLLKFYVQSPPWPHQKKCVFI